MSQEDNMRGKFTFTFEYIESQLKSAIDAGYTFLTCEEYFHLKANNKVP